MAQFNITQQFAEAIHLNVLEEPKEEFQLLDNWYIDVFHLNNEPVAIIVHAVTKFTFFIPFAEVKNPEEIPAYFVTLLTEIFEDAKIPEYIEQINNIFKPPFTFCKAENKEVLEHIHSFVKEAIQFCKPQKSIESIDWNEVAAQINNTPISISDTRSTISPKRLMSAFLNISLLEN